MQGITINANKVGKNYIAEYTVLEEEGRQFYYVVVQIGNLLYATFESSYLDYITGKVNKKPTRIEGADFLWFDIIEDRGDTRFWKYYRAAFEKANNLMRNDYIQRKYSHLKKPLGNIKYHIVDQKSVPLLDAAVYEMIFSITDTGETLLVQCDPQGRLSLSKVPLGFKPFDELPQDSVLVEEISSFSKAKYSDYYDLYLEMEKFRDSI